MGGASLADFEFDWSETLWTTPFVKSAFLVDVNSHINSATVEFYADKLSLFLFFQQHRFHRLRLNRRITGEVKYHCFLNIGVQTGNIIARPQETCSKLKIVTRFAGA